MEYRHIVNGDTDVTLSLFGGRRKECHAIIRISDISLPFRLQVKRITDRAIAIQKDVAEGLHPVFMRWFLSDIANQLPTVSDITGQLYSCPDHTPFNRCAVSMIQQAPLDGSKAALWVMFRETSAFIEIEPGIWHNLDGEVWMGDTLPPSSNPYEEARHYLLKFNGILRRLGGSLECNCLRTWFMVRDIDLNYHRMVEGRNDAFRLTGLLPSTHFIASTGINGLSVLPQLTVSFNAFADLSVYPGQITYLKGSSHLNPTMEYGVAFERGTAVDYPDRRHIYISGTASIDNEGKIVSPGDVRGQTLRMLENMEILLDEAGAVMNDVAHFIVYLRDYADYPTVKSIFNIRFPEIPALIVLAPVCRTGWLVEAECMAVTTYHKPLF